MSSLSLSLFFGHHDSSVTIGDENEILLHLEAERYFREKHCRIKTLEKMERLAAGALDYINGDISEVDRLYLSTLSNPLPGGKIKLLGRNLEPQITTHHNSHIGTVLDHGFNKALIIVADGGSEDGSTKVYLHDTDGFIFLLDDLGETPANGKFYGSLTMLVIEPDFLKAHGWDSGKTMGLSAYGSYSEDLVDKLKEYTPKMLWGNVLDVETALDFFNLSNDYRMPWSDARRMDLAHSGQAFWVESFVEHLTKYTKEVDNVVMVGGCALNVLLNSKLIDSGLFENIHIGPASGDCGQSIGNILFNERKVKCHGPFLGRGFGELGQYPDSLTEDLLSGKLVAWYQGRSEIGPRALGHRSILGLPNSEKQRDRLNKLKGREPYRPIAPMVLQDRFKDFFETEQLSPFMSFAPEAKEITQKLAPAIVHADGTSRLQTLSKEVNPILHKALSDIGEVTGAPILMNTSFNMAGEAMVDTPDDALRSFRKSGLDVMYINGERFE
ncbi:MAG: carbamoyltransferase C-terminal domain-containing protein [Bacteroidota bacterium]